MENINNTKATVPEMRYKHYVHVVDKHGNPLPPTTRCGRVRKLLESGKAVAICNSPFTIRLKYDVEYKYKQDFTLGLDSGRENDGIGVSDEKGECVYLSDVETNNKAVKSAMHDRAEHRSQRRRHDRQSKQRKARHDRTEIKKGDDDTCRTKIKCKSKQVSYPGAEKPVTHKIIQGKEGKFNNRHREEGWQTPSARQLVQVTMRGVENTAKILPITRIHVERVAFDFQKLENVNIHRWEYSKGPLYGFKDYKEYIFAEQNGKCLLCGAPIKEYHHITYRSRKGVDNVSNIAGLCCKCHDGLHRDQQTEDKLKELKAGCVQKYQVGLLNSAMPLMIEELQRYCEKHGLGFMVTNGIVTAEIRKKYNIPKDHCADGYAISLAGRDAKTISLPDTIYMQRRFKKKSGAIVAARNQREYWYNGKCVAKNRHKAENQKDDSLEEYMAKYAEKHSAKMCRKHMHELEIRPAKRTYTYHKEGRVAPAHPGDIIRYEKHNKVKGNTKTMVFVAVSVEYSEVERSEKGRKWKEREWKIGYGDGNKVRKAKYCERIGSGCLQTVDAVDTAKHLKKAEAEYQKYLATKPKRKKKQAKDKPASDTRKTA